MKCLEIKELTAVNCVLGKSMSCNACKYFCGVVQDEIQCSALSIDEEENRMKDRINDFIDDLKKTDHAVAPAYIIGKLHYVMS